jgi:hypothetical protein
MIAICRFVWGYQRTGRLEYFSVISINLVIQNIDFYVCDCFCEHYFGLGILL